MFLLLFVYRKFIIYIIEFNLMCDLSKIIDNIAAEEKSQFSIRVQFFFF